ncbi:MAG: bifunctional hydroxymethylpyrimidine kinase/phosphomethylpyrimidine kinase [Chloroflexi bacterium]|nr:bifunctional hydroxymethylpyrimidine kinase/phosphomethylpyrimidine kinase [Chloroflexota bacterium]
MTPTRVPRVMSIAGSDSGAGAGIQADLKTFGALGVFGTCAITTVTAQNTVGVDAALPIPPAMVEAQIDAIMADIGADAVKTGMLPGADIIRCVAQRLEFHAVAAVVIDPVLVNRAGTRLFDDDALEAMRSALFPRATVVTPNTCEASLLTGLEINTQDDLKNAAKALVEELGARNAVVKGGRMEGPATDVLYDGSNFLTFTSERIDTPNNHGTGCTLASAIAAGLARGLALPVAVQQAKDFVTAAMRASFPVGRGHGPLNHFHELWGRSAPPQEPSP